MGSANLSNLSSLKFVSYRIRRRSSTQLDLIRGVTSISCVRLFMDEKEVTKLRVKFCDVVFILLFVSFFDFVAFQKRDCFSVWFEASPETYLGFEGVQLCGCKVACFVFKSSMRLGRWEHDIFATTSQTSIAKIHYRLTKNRNDVSRSMTRRFVNRSAKSVTFLRRSKHSVSMSLLEPFRVSGFVALSNE